MAEGRTLTTHEVVERLNHSLEQEHTAGFEDVLPVSPKWGSPATQHRKQYQGGGEGAAHHPKQTGNATGANRPRTPGDGAGTAGLRVRANATLWSKLEASRLKALESLSSVLFDGQCPAQSTAKRVARVPAGERSGLHQREHVGGPRQAEPGADQWSLQTRLRQRAIALVEEERETLLRELHAELNSERKLFESRKPAILEEARRLATEEQASFLKKQERDVRTVLARLELKDLKDAARERLAVEYAQKKEKILVRLRRSLVRGTGHSVNGLRGDLWDEAQAQRTRALQEGEATFEHSSRLLRQQFDRSTQAKVEAMERGAMVEEKSALAVLQEVESKATADELSRVRIELEQRAQRDETELKQQMHAKAARSVAVVVDACTSKHKRAQQEATAKAAEELRRALGVVDEEEFARTKAVLEREGHLLDGRRNRIIAALEEGLSACYLRNLAAVESSSWSRPSPLPSRSPRKHAEIIRNSKHRNADEPGRRGEDETTLASEGVVGEGFDGDDDDGNGDCVTPSWRAVSAVRHVEGAAAAAEREYARRARRLVRSRAAAALRERGNNDKKGSGSNGGGVGTAGTEGACPSTARDKTGAEGVKEDDVVACSGCELLFEANEKLLREARARGFFVE